MQLMNSADASDGSNHQATFSFLGLPCALDLLSKGDPLDEHRHFAYQTATPKANNKLRCGQNVANIRQDALTL
jgi:hypothetical protein